MSQIELKLLTNSVVNGLLGSATTPEPFEFGINLTEAFHGIFFITCSSSIFIACSGSSVGGSLKLIFALAFGMTKFTASLTGGASIAKTSNAGSNQSLFEILSVSNRLISSDPSIFFKNDSSSSVTCISVGVRPSIMSSPFSL